MIPSEESAPNDDSTEINISRNDKDDVIIGDTSGRREKDPLSSFKTETVAAKLKGFFSKRLSMFLTVNYFSETYILLPSAFNSGGTLLTSIVVVLVSIQTYMMCLYFLEVCARAEYIVLQLQREQGDIKGDHQDQKNEEQVIVFGNDSAEDEGENDVQLKFQNKCQCDPMQGSETTMTTFVGDKSQTCSIDEEDIRGNSEDIRGNSVKHTDIESSVQSKQSTSAKQACALLPCIHDRKYEMSVLSQMFFGTWISIFFTAVTIFDFYGTTVVFCSVFASALSEQFPITGIVDGKGYSVYIGIFLAITIPLSGTSILQQVPVQLIFLAARQLAILLMIGTIIVALITDTDTDQSFLPQGVLDPSSKPALANFSQVFLVTQISIFATIIQCFVPCVADITPNKSSSTVKYTFQTAITYNTSLNIVLALLMVYYFHDKGPIPASSNLMWIDYVGIRSHASSGKQSVISTIISHYIVLIPAIDGISVNPLICSCLGDILMGAVYGKRVHEYESNWKICAAFRLLVSVPQAIAAIYIHDLGKIAAYAGLCALVSYTICPTVLYLVSSHYMQRNNMPTRTIYSSKFFSNDIVAYSLLVVVASIIVAYIVESIESYMQSHR